MTVGQAVQVDPVTTALTVSEEIKCSFLAALIKDNSVGFKFYWIYSEEHT